MKNSAQDVIEGIGGASQMAVQMVLWPLLLNSRSRWGATAEEVSQVLPGDVLVPEPKVQYTHAISIKAAKAKVWPWLAQIGQGRGGFYSYQWLENLVGCQIYNTDKILPEFQDLQNSGGVRLHPAMEPLPIYEIVPGDYFLLYGNTDMNMNKKSDEGTPAQDNFLKTTWLFHLQEIEPNHTRLISRWRADFPNTFTQKLLMGPPITGSMAHVMDIKMLKGIKHRAEKLN